jgi:hypothetical protein
MSNSLMSPLFEAGSSPVIGPKIELIIMRAEIAPLLWQWLQEFPKSNFDDYSPRTYEAFHDQLLKHPDESGHLAGPGLLDGDHEEVRQ